MTTTAGRPAAVVDVLTALSLGVIAAAINVGFHESVHSIACALTGGEVEGLSALAAYCDLVGESTRRTVAFSAPLVNLIIGTGLYLFLRRRPAPAGMGWYFLWLLMLMNWLAGSGYFLFSGVAGVGDMAVVIDGLEPGWVWRGLMLVVGLVLYAGAIWLALKLFGHYVGGTADEQIGRASRMAVWAYVGAVLAVLVASLFNTEGLLSLPVTAGLAGVVFGLSPLLWMMQWFRARTFEKRAGEPLSIPRSWPVVAGAVVALLVYGVWLGHGLTF